MKKILSTLLICIAVNYARAQNNLTLLGHLPYSVTCAGVWHYVDGSGNEYALVGASDRISIVNVTNPANPVEFYNIPALPGQTSLWREVKTYGTYAYAVSEGGGGVIVIDLSGLPFSVSHTRWYGDGAIAGQLTSAHAIAVTDGYLYIFGSTLANGGVLIADLVDPANPHYVGAYNQEYVHDGYIRNDTLWAGEIYAGQFSVIDVTNKSNPVLITTQQTPGQFCHNTWLSDNGEYLYTTDEVNGAPVGSFKVSDLNNIQLKSAYFCDSLPNEEVHNVRVLNDFIICPDYGSHLTVVDAARPHNLIEIANAPTVANTAQSYLCWDASPYLPSGNIIATDVGGGLYIFGMNYQRACYLEGTVTDSITTATLNNVLVELISSTVTTTSDVVGQYATGMATAGTFDVRFSKPGYITKTYPGISLSNGVLTTINAELAPLIITGTVVDSLTNAPIPFANIGVANDSISYSLTADNNGSFTISSLSSGAYTITASKWGYQPKCFTQLIESSSTFSFQLVQGYKDDFATDEGWTANSTCTTGAWTRAIPIGTSFGAGLANPDADVQSDCSSLCYVTGNGGGNATFDDVDNGETVLTSPAFDLTGYTDPYVNFDRWFMINSTVPAANSDTLFLYLNNGSTTVVIDLATLGTLGNASWVYRSLRVSNYLTPTSTMNMGLRVSDKNSSGNVVEAGFDNFSISEGTTGISETNAQNNIQVYPNPVKNSFTIECIPSLLTPDSYYVISDLAGRHVAKGRLTDAFQYIGLSEEVKSGLYILSLFQTTGPVFPVKLVKE